MDIYNGLKDVVVGDASKTLLMMEDKDGFRPLELAVHANCVQLFNAIINTPDVHLYKRERKGLI